MKKKKIKVMCFGTFDLLHPGHLNYLKQAKKHGNYLIVVIARDKTKKKQKKSTLFNEKERLSLIQSLSLVDLAVLGSLHDPLQVIKKFNPDILCLGYDQPLKISQLKEKLKELNLFPKIKRLSSYRGYKYKSTKLKQLLLSNIHKV